MISFSCAGQRAAQAVASSSEPTSMIQKPPSAYRDSANGPSVISGLPPLNDTRFSRSLSSCERVR